MNSPIIRPLVIIESPYAGNVAQNTAYLARAIKHSLALGEAPFASHAFYPRWLDDNKPLERQTGILCGLSFGLRAQLIAVYLDYGYSLGMTKAVEFYSSHGIQIQDRYIGKLDG